MKFIRLMDFARESVVGPEKCDCFIGCCSRDGWMDGVSERERREPAGRASSLLDGQRLARPLSALCQTHVQGVGGIFVHPEPVWLLSWPWGTYSRSHGPSRH